MMMGGRQWSRLMAEPEQRQGPTRRRRLVALIVVVVAVIGGLELFLGSAEERRRHGAEVEEITIESEAVGRSLPVKVIVPADAGEKPPLLVFLHGRNGDENDSLREATFDALSAQGSKAPIVALPDGDTDRYWHDRASGDWGSYVTEEVIPEVAREFGADPRRVAIGGISMGGFGALDIARLHPDRFCAIGAHSPAIWQTGAETAPGAFDDAADFERHDLVGSARTDPAGLATTPIRIDAGQTDPFQPGIKAFVAGLTASGLPPTSDTWPGGHGGWDEHWDEYARFYANALARCERDVG